MATALTRDEFMAFNAIAKSRRQLMAQTFMGTRLCLGKADMTKATWKLAKAGKDVFDVAHDMATGKDLSTQPFSPADAAREAKTLIAGISGVHGWSDLQEVLGGEVARDLVADMTPLVAIVTRSKKLATLAKRVVDESRAIYRADSLVQSFRPGAPAAAADAVTAIIRRDIAMHSVDFVRQSTAMGLRIAGVFADLGTASHAAVGLATSVAALGLRLYGLGLSIRDMQAGNRWLAHPETLSLEVFNDCPILGSYLLVSASTSDLINMFVSDIGLTPAWMTDVERVYDKQMTPLLKLAAKHVDESPLQLEGLQSMLRGSPSHMNRHFFVSLKQRASRYIHAR